MTEFLLDKGFGRTAFVKGKEYLFFSGYDYLAMHSLPAFTALIHEGIAQYGWLYASARISNTQTDLFAQCEALLSSITGQQETVLVSSGFTAGKMLLHLFNNNVINLQPSHPAIRADEKKLSTGIYAIDSVDVVQSAITRFDFVNPATHKKIIIDDSHGFGLIGKNGEGISSTLPQEKLIQYFFTYSLSKACNVIAGAISCNAAAAAELRAMPAFAASTPPSPAMMYAFLKGQSLYAEQREKLGENIAYFSLLTNHFSFMHHHPQLPVFILDNVNVDALFEKNIIISSFAYPNPAGKKVNRIVLNAAHTKADLAYTAECLESCAKNK